MPTLCLTYRLLLLVLCLQGFAAAQPSSFFYRQGNNISALDCNGVWFAPLTNQNHQAFGAGSVLMKTPINLTADFSVSFLLDFIDLPGADGGAFVFQADPRQAGETFHGLGVKGVNRSVAITFDAQSNAQHKDPPFDHAAIQTTGNVDHSSSANLAGPVNIEPYYRRITGTGPGPMPNQFYRVVTVQWKAALQELSVFVDGALLLRTANDLVQTVFGGNPQVYWGFAASNTQEQWFPANAEVTWGYLRFAIGDVVPRLAVRPETDTCFGPPVQVFDSSTYGRAGTLSGLSGVQWFWDFGDGTTSTLRNPPAHSYARAGVYTIRFAVTNAFGCTFDTVTKKIELGAPPVADFVVGAACAGKATAFTDKSTVANGGIFGWEWQFGNGSTSTNQNPTALFAAPGPQTVSLRVRSNLGCEGAVTKTIVVDETPVLVASHSQDCFGNVQYNAAVQNGVAVGGWRWSFGDGRTSKEQNPLHRFRQNSQYRSLLWAMGTGGCVSDTVAQTVVVDVPQAFAGNDTVVVKGQPLRLNGSGGRSYRWSPSAGLNDAFSATPTATLWADQDYVLTVTNSRGCTDSDTLHIRVFNASNFYVPTAFTPNGDGRNDALQWVAPGFRHLHYFRVYNRWGQLLFETQNLSGSWNGRFANTDVPPGVYVWTAAGTDADNRRQERRGTVVLLR